MKGINSSINILIFFLMLKTHVWLMIHPAMNDNNIIIIIIIVKKEKGEKTKNWPAQLNSFELTILHAVHLNIKC